MLAPIAVLQAAYEGMTWSGQPITCVPPATATDMQLIIDQLTVIQPGFNFETDANSRRVKQLLQLSAFLDRHCRSGLYVWQYQRYPSDTPPLPVAAPDAAASGADVGTPAPPTRQPAARGARQPRTASRNSTRCIQRPIPPVAAISRAMRCSATTAATRHGER